MNAYQAGQKLLCGDYFSYTPTGVSQFKKLNRYTQVGADIRKGDIGFFYYSSLGRVGHVYAAIVVENDTAKKQIKIITLEGNSGSNTYERNGGMVCSKTHVISYGDIGNYKTFHGFGHPQYGNDTCTVDEFIEVLKGELGYVEKASNSKIGASDRQATEEEKTANKGLNNYTKYGAWYGMNGVAWCAEFISWCAWFACKKHLEKANVKSGWEQIKDYWVYRKNGSLIQKAWEYINGRWYVFDGEGKMIKGWFKSVEGWYYLGEDGGMLAGQWVTDKGKSYYLTASGVMASDAYIKSAKPNKDGRYEYYWVGSDGAWDPAWDTTNPCLDVCDVVK